MSWRSIEWLREEDVTAVLDSLRQQYQEESIVVVNPGPIGYVLNLAAISGYFQDDVVMLAAVVFRSIIQGHPLQDGNKRLGMILGTYFLSINGLALQASDREYIQVALALARGDLDRQDLYRWLQGHCVG